MVVGTTYITFLYLLLQCFERTWLVHQSTDTCNLDFPRPMVELQNPYIRLSTVHARMGL